MAADPSLSTDYKSHEQSDLIRRCAQEMLRFRKQKPYDPWHCYELFRRALVERDEAAWAAIYKQYQRLVRFWIGTSGDDADALVNQAFAKLWQGIDTDCLTHRT